MTRSRSSCWAREPLLPSLLERIRARLPKAAIFSYYGQTEAPYSCWARQDDGSVALGIIGPGPHVGCGPGGRRIRRAHRRRVGEIQLTGPHLMCGLRRPARQDGPVTARWLVHRGRPWCDRRRRRLDRARATRGRDPQGRPVDASQRHRGRSHGSSMVLRKPARSGFPRERTNNASSSPSFPGRGTRSRPPTSKRNWNRFPPPAAPTLWSWWRSYHTQMMPPVVGANCCDGKSARDGASN